MAVFDEMKIREDIVFDKSTGKVTGFIEANLDQRFLAAEIMCKAKVESQQSFHKHAHLDDPWNFL